MNVITCEQWGARPIDTRRLSRQPAVGCVIHHTASALARVKEDTDEERERCCRLARAIQRSHMARRWMDSGHHWLVSRSGLILEGRHGTLNAARNGRVIRGSHAGDNWANSRMFGIECEGLYTHEEPPQALWEALVELTAHLAWWGEFQSQDMEGHRIYRATQCPGEKLFARLPELRWAVHVRKTELLAG